jgi:hypothetical protein
MTTRSDLDDLPLPSPDSLTRGRRSECHCMPRFKNIREEVQEMVERLYELHDMTDPRKGNKSEIDKLERAQRAIDIWWYIYARLMQWAQSHIIGYEMARLNPACQTLLEARRGGPLTEDSHELEVLGSLYAANVPGYMTLEEMENDDRDELSEKLERRKVDLDDATLRRVIVRLLLSTSANSSVWRFPLSHALRALNYGEQDQFFKPSKSRRRGQSYQLDWARANAVAHIHYLLGKGLKKHVATAKVADGIAVSPETLRDGKRS